MSIVGNLIFTPFLFLFIFFSFFMFLTELLCIPNGVLCHILNTLAYVWFKALSYGSPKWLIGFADPGLLYLALFITVGIISFWVTHTWQLTWRTAALSIILLICASMLKWCIPIPNECILLYSKANVHVTNTNNQLTLTIPHTRLRQKSFASWFTHTASPELYKTFGHNIITNLVLENPTAHMIDVIKANRELLGYQELTIINASRKHCS
jgi:hypothetical protein